MFYILTFLTLGTLPGIVIYLRAVREYLRDFRIKNINV